MREFIRVDMPWVVASRMCLVALQGTGGRCQVAEEQLLLPARILDRLLQFAEVDEQTGDVVVRIPARVATELKEMTKLGTGT